MLRTDQHAENWSISISISIRFAQGRHQPPPSVGVRLWLKGPAQPKQSRLDLDARTLKSRRLNPGHALGQAYNPPPPTRCFRAGLPNGRADPEPSNAAVGCFELYTHVGDDGMAPAAFDGYENINLAQDPAHREKLQVRG